MNADKMLAEIRETNLSYLLLASNMIQHDKAEATYRLGINDDLADMIASLSMAQMVRIAASNMLMCRFRFDDPMVWNLVTDHGQPNGKDASMSKIHAAIAIANQPLAVA